MKMHPRLEGTIDQTDLFELAKKAGLDQINYEKYHDIRKVAYKDEKKKRNLDVGYYSRGFPYLIGDGKNCVALYINGISEWFQTSPVVAVKKTDSGYEVETQNSFYELTER